MRTKRPLLIVGALGLVACGSDPDSLTGRPPAAAEDPPSNTSATDPAPDDPSPGSLSDAGGPDAKMGADAGAGGDAAPDAGAGLSVLDDARLYNLTRINALRAAHGRGPLALDKTLDDFAQAASTELSIDHAGHQYFIGHASTCGCGALAENQGDPSGWNPAPVHQQIDQILSTMMAEGAGGGHYQNILLANATKLGVGIVNPGGVLFFTNDFGH
jgi:uncharacterized protein YkwD